MFLLPSQSRPARAFASRRARPEVLRLETRLALSVARPTLRAAAAAAADVVAMRGSLVAGTLDIQGTSGADTVEIGRSARGFVTVTSDGVVRSGDLRDRGTFDRRLAGLRVDRLRVVRLAGDDPFDTVVLNTMLGTSARPARIQSNAVTIAAPVNQAGTLRIEARSITVSADVRADAIVLSASGLLNLEAGGSLTASKSIELKADRLIQTGNLAAPAVSMTANVLMRSGTITAPGGAVDVQFTENYVATQNATIDVSGPALGGSIRIDGGATGHLFNSGTLLATGTGTGGAVRISGKDVVWIGGGAYVSGGTSGGRIHIGGGWQGSDASMTKARTLKVSPHTVIQADGGILGGTVVLWSEEATTNYGTILARGAKGGAVEVSSKVELAHGGAVDVGPGGRFLLDPKNIVIADNVMGGVPMFELVNPTPNVNDDFGWSIVPLSTGNVVVTDQYDDAVATDAGAVYLYDGATGALIATLTGTTANDQVGSTGLTALSNENYVVRSQNWDNGAATNAGAVTWGSGTTGISGTVSASNSLVGSTANDQVGSTGVLTLSNGNYVVRSQNWDNGAATDAGAATWMNGASGATLTGSIGGAVSTVNSFVGIGSNAPVVDNVNGSLLIRRSTLGGAVYVNLLTPLPSGVTFAAYAASSANMSPAFVATPLSAGTATTLQANNDITLSIPLTVNNPAGNGGALTLQAGRSVTFNANLTTDGGALNVLANADTSAGVVSAQRDAGAGGVNIPASIAIDAGSGAVSLASGTAAGLTNRTSGGVTIGGTVTASSVTIATADSGSGTPSVTVNGTLNMAGPLTIQSDGPVNFGAASVVTGVTGVAITTSNDPVSFAGAFPYSGNLQITAGTGLVSFADDWAIGSGTAFVSSTQAVTVADVLSLNGGMLLTTAGLSIGGSGTVRGSGNIVSPISLGASVTIAPGAGGLSTGSGTLNFGQALSLPATGTVAMNGTSKSAFDKIVANGVNLAGATLSLDLSTATLIAGDAITLVDNVAGSAVTGTFAGLAQGALFTANGNTMQISYTGGDGNDVVVTKVADITASFSVSRSGFLYLVPSNTYRQTITLTNLTPTAKKPRTFKFVGLPGGVSVVGGTQSGPDWFLNIGDLTVPANGSLGVAVQFAVPSGNSFTYTLEVLGG